MKNDASLDMPICSLEHTDSVDAHDYGCVVYAEWRTVTSCALI